MAWLEINTIACLNRCTSRQRASSKWTSVITHNTPVLVQLFELSGHGLAPPLPLQCLCALAAFVVVPFDDCPVQVKQGDLGTSGWVEVDTVQTRAFGAERGFEPLKSRGLGCAWFGEEGVDWVARWSTTSMRDLVVCSLFAILRALLMESSAASAPSWSCAMLRFLAGSGPSCIQCVLCDGALDLRSAADWFDGPGSDMIARVKAMQVFHKNRI